jgi:hypothetical protein
MASNEGSAMLSLKNKMQMIMEDLDRYKSLYEQARISLEEEKKQRSQVNEISVQWAWPIFGYSSSVYR